MKKISKFKSIMLATVTAVCAAFSALSVSRLSELSADAYTSSNMSTAATIANIYKGDGAFNQNNLDALAKKVSGCNKIDDLVALAEGGTVKNSAAFGQTIVKFGSYTFNGTTRELSWIPVYLSKSSDGAAILTLWLANTANANGTISNQEISAFAALSTSSATTFNGKTVYSSGYSASYIHNCILNGRSTCAWKSSISIPANLTKFSKFAAGGELSNFIVTPSKVSWQMAENKMKNDPKYTGANYANFTSDWTNDNVWLPSQ